MSNFFSELKRRNVIRAVILYVGAVWALVGSAVTTSVTTPFVALYSTLLYYDLLARAGSPSAAGERG